MAIKFILSKLKKVKNSTADKEEKKQTNRKFSKDLDTQSNASSNKAKQKKQTNNQINKDLDTQSVASLNKPTFTNKVNPEILKNDFDINDDTKEIIEQGLLNRRSVSIYSQEESNQVTKLKVVKEHKVCSSDPTYLNSKNLNINGQLGTVQLNQIYNSIKSPLSSDVFNATPENQDSTQEDEEVGIKEQNGFVDFNPKFHQPTPGKGRPFRILSIDGGGVKGIIPATILHQLEVQANKPIHQLFDLIAGTSTGAILSIMLILPEDADENDIQFKDKPKFRASDGINLYLEKCPQIFQTTLLRRIQTLAGLANAQYSSTNKTKVLKDYCKDLKISNLLTDILIPTFDIREGKPYFFKSSKVRRNGAVSDYKLIDVLDATSSAPTYFAPHQVKGYDSPQPQNYRSFLDGAITANDPALCALAEAYRHYDADPKSTVLVSLGCGSSSIGVDHEVSKNWGALNWAPYFPNLMLSSSVNTVHYQLSHLIPPKHYFRLQTELPNDKNDIDNVQKSHLIWLKDRGDSLAAKHRTDIQRLAKLLVEIGEKGQHYRKDSNQDKISYTPKDTTLNNIDESLLLNLKIAA